MVAPIAGVFYKILAETTAVTDVVPARSIYQEFAAGDADDPYITINHVEFEPYNTLAYRAVAGNSTIEVSGFGSDLKLPTIRDLREAVKNALAAYGPTTETIDGDSVEVYSIIEDTSRIGSVVAYSDATGKDRTGFAFTLRFFSTHEV